MDEKKLIVKAYGASNIGKVRQENQDSFYMDGKYMHQQNQNDTFKMELSASIPQVYAVFDGLGGEEGGEVSSRTACSVMSAYQGKIAAATSDNLEEVYTAFATEANKKICRELRSYLYPRGGTTFVSVQLSDGVIHPFYLGDSRIYLAFEDSLYLLSDDHTVAMEKVRNGQMTIEEAIQSPENHMLTNFLGDTPSLGTVKPAACAYIKMEAGMSILLCSDGLHDMVPGTIIYDLMMNSENPAEELVQKALDNGGFDNVTPVVIRIEEE